MSDSLTSAQYEVNDLETAIEFYFERGWTDGLPVVPPTERNVSHMIEASGRDPGEVIGQYPTRRLEVKVEKVAINAVMAGCRPEYFPVVLAIIEAICDPVFGVHTPNATTGGAAIGFVVNGPIRNSLGMNYRGNVFGPGNRANSTIGRAIRLTQINVMGSVAGAGNEAEERPILDRATMGQPAKYAGYHLPENEELFPSLQPLHVELGYEATDSVTTVFATGGHMQLSAHAEHGAEAIVDTILHYLVGAGKLGSRWCVLAIPPENAEHFVRDGWSKADIRQALFDGSARSVAWLKEHRYSASGGVLDPRGGPILAGDRDKMITLGRHPKDIYLVIAGGPAGAFIHCLTPYGGPPVSKMIRI